MKQPTGLLFRPSTGCAIWLHILTTVSISPLLREFPEASVPDWIALKDL